MTRMCMSVHVYKSCSYARLGYVCVSSKDKWLANTHVQTQAADFLSRHIIYNKTHTHTQSGWQVTFTLGNPVCVYGRTRDSISSFFSKLRSSCRYYSLMQIFIAVQSKQLQCQIQTKVCAFLFVENILINLSIKRDTPKNLWQRLNFYLCPILNLIIY